MINIDELAIMANRKEDENLRFRSYLKGHADPDILDRHFKELHEKYFKIYNCKDCRNCCKKLNTSMTEEELDTICNKLNLDKEELISNELDINTSGKYSFKCNRCKFLDDDNNCLAENCLPESCRDYPYTNKSERLFSLYGIISNASICPVVYEILEELKKIYNFKR